MGTHTVANETIWPTQNDIAQTTGDGNKIKENQMIKPFIAVLPNNYALTGFTVPGTSGTLGIDVAAGTALIAGRHVTMPSATNVTAAASNANYVFLKLSRDGSNLVTGLQIEVNITGTAPADSILIATLTAGASTISATVDTRILPGTIRTLTSGTAWTPPAGIFSIYAEVIGASGGGGGGGASGASPTAGTAGTAGGTTTFGAMSVTAGEAGPAGVIGTTAGSQGANHGVGSGGSINRTGAGNPGGSGGQGGGNASHNGGKGGDGGYSAAYVTTAPGVDVTYSIGAAGANGAAGTGSTGNGAAGRNGTAGLILIHF